MPGFFDALSQRNSPKKKTHTVVIDGIEIEVTLEKKLEILRSGQENYYIKDSTVFKKEQSKIVFDQLKKSENGIIFYNQNPFWIESEGVGGYKWTTE